MEICERFDSYIATSRKPKSMKGRIFWSISLSRSLIDALKLWSGEEWEWQIGADLRKVTRETLSELDSQIMSAT